MLKISPENIPYRYREIVKKNENISLSYDGTLTMFAQSEYPSNFVRI